MVMEGKYKDALVIGCVLERDALFSASQLMSRSGWCWFVLNRRKRERRWRWEEGIYVLEFGRFLGSTCELCVLTNRKRPSLRHAEPHASTSTTSLETRFSTRGEGSL